MSSFDPRIPNQPVQVRGRPGVTTGRVRQSGTREYVQVQFGPQETTFVAIEDAEPIDTGKPGAGDLVRAKRFGHKGDLGRILTFHKISSRLANVFYAMQTSRTDFYAYQFKPVYKFIESANGRILIADEVGLGKTIEAALIWQEVRARSDARTLLIVCPSMLRDKWKTELRTRFEVPAQIHSSDGFLSLLQDFKREGLGYQCAAVCSLQGLRNPTVQGALEDFADSELQFDLIVIDEAHYMRNVDTHTHRLGKALSGIADNFLLLTATPLQLKREDLYRLLNVLDPDEYDNHSLFEARTEANEPLVLAQNALRRIPPDVPFVKKHLASMMESPWFSNNPLLGLAISKVNDLDTANVAELIEATRLLEDLNLLGSSISRTRKHEVQEWKVIRKAKVLRLRYSDQEMAFYDGVTDAVRKQISASGNAGFEAFALMMPQRQMASCIPAMIHHYRGLWASDEFEENAGYELGWAQPEGDTITSSKAKLNPDIERLIANWLLDRPDSKYDALFKEIRALFEEESDTKLIIFSYFKKTLAYLAERLSKDGYPALVIHGDIAMAERLDIINTFRERFDHRILLSSEVGSEGLDLQFCRVIINYDLPWNPMRVEQRIGRLDRLGQQSPSISIINIAAMNTIEDRILERLYSRIGVFERSIGDLEPILGDMIQQLEFDLLSCRLTPQQEEDRIEQTRLALEQKRKLEADLEDQSQLFFGNSDFVLEQIRDARKTGRWITPAEVRSYVIDFFQKRYSGTQILWDTPNAGFVTIDLVNSARTDLAFHCRRSDEMFTSLAVNSGATVLAYTSDAANQQPRTEFLTHFHPLIRWITELYSVQTDPAPFFPSVAVQVRSDLAPVGDYTFSVEKWRFSAIQEEPQIAYAVVRIGKEDTADRLVAEQLVQEILEKGESWAHADRILDSEEICRALSRCEKVLASYRESAFEAFEKRMIAIYQRKKAHRENYLARREEAIRSAIEKLETRRVWEDTPKTRTSAQIRGQQTKLSNLRLKIELELQQLEKKSRGKLEFDEVVGGVCRVKG